MVPGLAPVDAATASSAKNADTVASGIRVFRLKDKLGTRQLPTAEMELTGVRFWSCCPWYVALGHYMVVVINIAHCAQVKAWRVSVPGRGVSAIAITMVNLTRLHNAISACSYMRRVVALVRDYAHRYAQLEHQTEVVLLVGHDV